MIFRQFLRLTNILKAPIFFVYKYTKVIVVNEDKNLEFAAF